MEVKKVSKGREQLSDHHSNVSGDTLPLKEDHLEYPRMMLRYTIKGSSDTNRVFNKVSH